MSWKLRAAMTALLLAPQAAWALGLGDIRLSSALNEPLAAEIDLVAPTPDELTSLSAQLASREQFQRYGLDRPAFLDTVQFRVGVGRDGRNVLLLSSAAPMAEPFLTFLVEVNWPRGRLLREYTVLLDPPVFAPAAAAPPPPVAAPRVAAAPPAPVAAPVPAPAPAPAPAAVQAEAAAAPRPAPAPRAAPSVPMAGGSYSVQSGDTLSGIAARLIDGDRAAANRMMIALFRANPEAFGGNINLLLANSTLRVPGPEELQSIDTREASSEIGRQTSAWQSGRAAAEPARLRLVTPAEAPAEALPADAMASDIEARIGRLSGEIDESRRLLDLKSSELAELQERLARERAAAAPVPAEAPAASAETPAAATEAGAAAGEAPVAETAPPPTAEPEAPAATPVVSAPSFVDRLTDNWSYVLGAAVLLLGGGLAYGYMRRRREEDLDEALKSFEPSTAPNPPDVQRPRPLATAPAAPVAAAGAAAAAAYTPTLELRALRPELASRDAAPTEDTLSVEEPLEFDQTDPLAEADFHMAYGLYDQAADIVKLGLEREPGRSDYKMKLLEIFFVSGNKARFLDTAREIGATRTPAGAADWDRVVIMGRQLATEDPMFVGAAMGSSVDINLEGGASRVDLELLSPPVGDEGVDFDLGEAFQPKESLSDTGESELLDFDLEPTEPPTAEMPRLADDTAEMPTVEVMTGDAPTVVATLLRRSNEQTVLEPVQRRGFTAEPQGLDSTAEMPMDDLGIDLGDFAELDSRDDVTRLDAADSDDYEQGTAVLPKLEDGMDFDLTEASDDLTATQSVDSDLVATQAASEAGGIASTQRLYLGGLPEISELEPVTMSEVGTKLDLARAYVDMGDPEGARSILEEVLSEGSASQRDEAQRLIDGLPGA